MTGKKKPQPGEVDALLPSPAWERLKAKPKPKVVKTEAGPGMPGVVTVPVYVRPGSCRCYQSHVGGHRPDCYLFMVRCPDCGQHSGNHKWDCPFWDSHPGLTPFDGNGNYKPGMLGD